MHDAMVTVAQMLLTEIEQETQRIARESKIGDDLGEVPTDEGVARLGLNDDVAIDHQIQLIAAFDPDAVKDHGQLDLHRHMVTAISQQFRHATDVTFSRQPAPIRVWTS